MCVNMCVCVSACVCVCARVGMCVCARVGMCMCACAHTYTHLTLCFGYLLLRLTATYKQKMKLYSHRHLTYSYSIQAFWGVDLRVLGPYRNTDSNALCSRKLKIYLQKTDWGRKKERKPKSDKRKWKDKSNSYIRNAANPQSSFSSPCFGVLLGPGWCKRDVWSRTAIESKTGGL